MSNVVRDNTAGQQPREASRRDVISPAEAELLAIIPSRTAAILLVNNYFDKVHWFMLIFHQSDFRGALRQLYRELDEKGPRQPTSVGLGFLSVLTAVCIISLQYIDDRQRKYLCDCVIVADDLQKRLLDALRMRLLEVVAQGSIEAVQACVLLGSFYLYHGEPELTWPICGCGLRIAQALNLHRRRPQSGGTPGPPDLDDPGQRAEETRKRCWWAVYEIETTCSMLYGFPLNINDDDCDVQLLCPYPLRSSDASWDSSIRQQMGQATLLSYKHAMAQLSIIVKSALTDLYGLRQRRTHANGNSGAADRDRTSDTCQSSTQVCRDAALEISNIGSLPLFQGVADTYAVSFVSLHLLTAAIALSILTTLAPLTQESHDCKMGIRRLMEMQSRLRVRSIVAEQGLGILKKLMSLVLTKEMKEMLEFPRPSEDTTTATAAAVDGEVGVDNNLNPPLPGAQEVRASVAERREACQTASQLDNQSIDSTSANASSVFTPAAAVGDIASQGFSFYKDPTITQALLDFEQVSAMDPVDKPVMN
ncbi:hypothetical protein INS49_008998 [Diaporthe citri]|uniref:uncharacterized protein n=1 Tax=Diaporthe citri TaxID=83186 RepID=UPI001C8079D9|nr:uncharacterized protein INS49_008998 [Diaporthe citri]KAG6363895.1 hypothetical protein INS49_008998 [Diaporthe citri]